MYRACVVYRRNRARLDKQETGVHLALTTTNRDNQHLIRIDVEFTVFEVD
jgi:hypothetical protein